MKVIVADGAAGGATAAEAASGTSVADGAVAAADGAAAAAVGAAAGVSVAGGVADGAAIGKMKRNTGEKEVTGRCGWKSRVRRKKMETSVPRKEVTGL